MSWKEKENKRVFKGKGYFTEKTGKIGEVNDVLFDIKPLNKIIFFRKCIFENTLIEVTLSYIEYFVAPEG